jgi:hypothetical protein
LPSYVRANKLKPDVPYYIEKQLMNPLSQLFALRVEEIPGYCAPVNGWPENPDKRAVARENMAGTLLFQEALRTCEKALRQKAALKLGFKVNVNAAASGNTSGGAEKTNRVVRVDSIPVSTKAASTGPKKQMVLDSWFADKILVDSLKQKKQKEAKAANGTISKSPPSGGNRTNVIVNSNAVAVAVSGAGAGAAAYYGGGGGGGYYAPPSATGMIQGLDVQGLRRTRQVAYEATRARTRRIVIRAFCLDDRDVPHPAAQVFPDRDVQDGYEGELYRCVAGTRMQITIAEFADLGQLFRSQPSSTRPPFFSTR